MENFLLCFVFMTIFACSVAENPVDIKLTQDTDLSQFFSLIERNEGANVTLKLKQVTIFAPTNDAFQKFEQKMDDDTNFVMYHMANIPKTVDELGSTNYLSSEADGHPPLWITHKTGTYHDDFYINNARLITRKSNVRGKNKIGKDQVLHKIDEVLVPTISAKNSNKMVYNPNAWEFIDNFEGLNINNFNPHRVRIFRERIERLRKQDMFKAEGGYTFFIPVDEGFKNAKAEHIDAKVIDGHIIPKDVLFTAPTEREMPYETLAEVDNIKVKISFTKKTDEKSNSVYVKSHTIMGDNIHKAGVVLAEIVKANIPVKNGVIHLIHKPLMVVDNTVKEFLEEKEDGPVKQFIQHIKDSGDVGEAFMRRISHSGDVTLFAPTNTAWDDGNLQSLLQDKHRMKEILDMHLVVDKRLPKAKIIDNLRKHDYQATTSDPKRHLYFNVVTIGNNQTLTVEGGGVNATVIQEDIAATNGIIHIIDRVLGVPYATVLDKLRTDPLLNMTYYLGQRTGINAQLNDTTRKFTYFVPRDKAWNDARIELPSAIKKLFMPDFSYHAAQILERHLVVSDTVYTLEKIKNMSNDSNNYNIYNGARNEVPLTTMRDQLNIYVEERQDHTFIIHWKGIKIPVFRPNVECTNGIIHVIDAPFLREGDIRVSSAPSLSMLAPHMLMIIAARWILL